MTLLPVLFLPELATLVATTGWYPPAGVGYTAGVLSGLALTLGAIAWRATHRRRPPRKVPAPVRD